MTATTIPVLDLHEWAGAAEDRRRHIAADVDRALRGTGMVLLRGHDVPDDLTGAMRTQGRRFFALPTSAKQDYRVARPYDNGWRGIGELVVGGLDDGSTDAAPADLHEAFHIGPDHRTGDPAFDARYYPANKWPAEVPELRDCASRYTTEMVRLAQTLLEVLAEVLGLAGTTFTAQTSRATWTQNINWYPSLEDTGAVAEGQMRVGPHSDFGTVTVLDRERGVGGLEVWNDETGWHAPPFEAGTLAVLLGDLMQVWTDGRWRPLRHRVLAPASSAPAEELVSLVFFFEADPDARLVPLPEPAGGGAGFAAVTAGETIMEKVRGSLALEEDTR